MDDSLPESWEMFAVQVSTAVDLLNTLIHIYIHPNDSKSSETCHTLPIIILYPIKLMKWSFTAQLSHHIALARLRLSSYPPQPQLSVQSLPL